MRVPQPRPMSFDVRSIEGTSSDERWHWFVYDGSDGDFIRNGQISGDRDKAERAARAAIAIMGGAVLDPKQGEHRE